MDPSPKTIEELRSLRVTQGHPTTALEWFPFLVAMQAGEYPRIARDYLRDLGFDFKDWVTFSTELQDQLWRNRGYLISEETIPQAKVAGIPLILHLHKESRSKTYALRLMYGKRTTTRGLGGQWTWRPACRLSSEPVWKFGTRDINKVGPAQLVSASRRLRIPLVVPCGGYSTADFFKTEESDWAKKVGHKGKYPPVREWVSVPFGVASILRDREGSPPWSRGNYLDISPWANYWYFTSLAPRVPDFWPPVFSDQLMPFNLSPVAIKDRWWTLLSDGSPLGKALDE